MGILDWFKNRPSQFDLDRLSDDLTRRAIDKAVTLTNPRLKLLDSYQERLFPAVETSVQYLLGMLKSVSPAIQVSTADWSADPALKAFFVTASDIPSILGRSRNLRTLFDKYPDLDEAHLVLDMAYSEQRGLGMSLQGDIVQRDVAQTVVSFSGHQVRICGQSDQEVRRLLGTQIYEYLLAQAISEISDERSERRELEDNRALIRARLRLLQQQGPGLGSVFGSAPESLSEQMKLEAQLLENDRQMEAMGDLQSVLDNELDSLKEVLEHPERYVQIEAKRLRLNTMNVVVDESNTDVAADIEFSLVKLTGGQAVQRAFVLAHFARGEMPAPPSNFDDAERYL